MGALTSALFFMSLCFKVMQTETSSWTVTMPSSVLNFKSHKKMGALKWLLFFVCLCFKVIQTGASSWTATVPSSVKGLSGSCVVIPCSYDYPAPGKTLTEFKGIWMKVEEDVIYHSDKTQIKQEYKTRTELVGDTKQKNCSLKIDPLRQSDQGPFYFRIEIGGYDKYSYKEKKVSLTIIGAPDPPDVTVKEEEVEGQTVSASCSVSHSCPPSPPEFTWNHSGDKNLQSQQLDDGQWKATSTLTFRPTKDDHNKALTCTVRFKGGIQRERTSNVLRVKYAPVNVKVDYKSDVKEGESVQLKCSSEANPPANSYQWYNEAGAQLYQGKSYMLPNVSRHTGALYCTATNTVGQSKSSPVQFSVLFPPEIKNMSCSSEGDKLKCVCTVESRPPSMVQFVLSDRILPSTKTETHGYVTIGTVQTESGSSEFVDCLANNTLGNMTLTHTLSGKMQNIYIFIAAGAGISLVILLIVLGVVRKCRRRTGDEAASQMSTTKEEKAVELQYASTKSRRRPAPAPPSYKSDTKAKQTVEQKQTGYEDKYDDHIYDNMEDEAIYANT